MSRNKEITTELNEAKPDFQPVHMGGNKAIVTRRHEGGTFAALPISLTATTQ